MKFNFMLLHFIHLLLFSTAVKFNNTLKEAALKAGSDSTCVFLLFLLILPVCRLTRSTLEDAGLFPECPWGLAVSLHRARLSALLTSAG